MAKQQQIEKTRLKAAEAYVKRQLETMQQYGSAPKRLSAAAFRALVHQVANAAK